MYRGENSWGSWGRLVCFPRVGRFAAEVATPDASPAPGYKVLKPAQVAALEAIAEQIIPAGQDPGAREAGAVRYIDRVLAGEQSYRLPVYTTGLVAIDQTSQAMFTHNFVHASSDQQIAQC